jgi:hypothetical protein
MTGPTLDELNENDYLGRLAYYAYGEHVGGFDVHGVPLPNWEALRPRRQSAWTRAARLAAAYDRYVRDQGEITEAAQLAFERLDQAVAPWNVAEADRREAARDAEPTEPPKKPSIKQYEPGQRVELVYLCDETSALRPGTRGTVQHVDGLNTVHVRWDDGATLGIIEEAGDVIRVITPTNPTVDRVVEKLYGDAESTDG